MPNFDIEKELTDKGYTAKFIKTDISDEAQVINAMKIIEETFGKVDVLYNNASVFLGGGRDNKMAELSSEIWNKILKINLYGTYHCRIRS